MKKVLSLVFAIIFIGTVTACAPQQEDKQQTQEKKINVVTSFYPLSDIVAKVGKERVTLKNLVSAGLEPHDYELTPQDIIGLNSANLVIYNGAGLEPWSEKIVPQLQKNTVRTFNVSSIFGNASDDPHFWLSPINYIKEVAAIKNQLAEIDPEKREFYGQNANFFIDQLNQLDLDYKTGLKTCKLNTFVTTHAAFGYLAKEYKLEMLPVAGISPEAEPSTKTLIEVSKTIKNKKINYVLVENLAETKIADVLAKETGAKILQLSPLESLTKEETANGEDYISVMRKNLKNLRTALECN